MKRIVLALALSALSLVGGHFYNRRWDRAVLFFVALLSWGIGIYFAAMRRVMEAAVTNDGEDVSEVFLGYWHIFLVGTVVLWAVSLLFAALDAQRVDASRAYRWTPTGVVAASGLSLLVAAFLGMQSLLALTTVTGRITVEDSPESVSSARNYRGKSFWNYVHFGRTSAAPDEFERPPSGDGYLRGRFVYHDKPAEGVRLSLVLNAKYETEKVTTDEDGIFTVRLARGDWTVNALLTHTWARRPQGEGDFIIVSGQEPKLVDGRYNDYYWMEREGLRVAVTDQRAEPQLEFTIRERIVMTWPEADERGAETTLEEGVIAWEAYPGAHTYLLQIMELQREGRTTRFTPVTVRPIAGGATSLALADLEAVPGDEEKEYSVSVLAFAEDDTFLSESEETFDQGTFVLTDRLELVRDVERELLGGDFEADEVEQLRRNSRRIEAIETLLKDDLIDEAEKVLAKIAGPVGAGRKAAITGYLMAKRGRCEEANKLFEKALSEGGRNCIPEHYRAPCE